jgi:hypothetical protein
MVLTASSIKSDPPQVLILPYPRIAFNRRECNSFSISAKETKTFWQVGLKVTTEAGESDVS